MKLWKAQSATFKTHFFSALCRCLFTNSCWIFATSLFVKVVGSKGYSQLFFFASSAALLYYMYFAVRGHKEREPYNVYRAVLILAFLASVGCFLEPQTAALHPFNEFLLYAFVVSVMTVDLIGTTLGPIVLQSSTNPAVFRTVYQKIIAFELTARITAAAIVWILSQAHQLDFLYPFAWFLLTMHFYLFGVTVWRMNVAKTKARVPDSSEPPAIENVRSSFKFIINNPLVRVAMSVMIWSTVSKFVLENLFYQVADAEFGSARQLASFVSVMSMVIYALSLALHPLIIKLLNARLQLSTLLSIQPLNILILGGIALVLPPFWPLVLLMVSYNIAHRSIQVPMSRQCLVPVPRNNRGTIVSLISIMVAVSTMTTSGVMALMKNALHLEDYLVFLLILGAAILFMVTSLDSYYIRNLWSLFREVRFGHWQDEPQLETISMVEIEAGSTPLVETPASDLELHPILETYATSYDHEKLKSASDEHQVLLKSEKPDLLLAGLKICYVADFPWLRESLKNARESKSSQIRTFANQAEQVTMELGGMNNFTSVFRRKIKSLALEMLSENHGDASCLRELKKIICCNDPSAAESLVSALGESGSKPARNLLLSCIEEGGNISIAPIINVMCEKNFANAGAERSLLERLPFGKTTSDLKRIIETNLAGLKHERLAIGPQQDASRKHHLELFMHTLFLEEYRLSPIPDRALTESISEFSILSIEESGILVDMHLSFLKKSDLFQSWESILNVIEPATVS